ncbi:MAG: MFS transporter, partial [Pseudomonadota bacterium]
MVVSLRFCYMALYASQFIFLGVQLPFFPGWLDARGFTPESIGVLIGVALVLRLIFSPLIAYQMGKQTDGRFPILAASFGLFSASAILLFPLPQFVIALASIALLFSFGLLVPLTDAAVLRADRQGQLNYGRVRSVGSVSFIAASLLGGIVIGMTTQNMVVIWMSLAGASAVLISLILPREKRLSAQGEKQKPNLAQAIGLFRSTSFLLMLFAGGLIQGSHATYYAFSELHWSDLGYSSFLIGSLWAVGVAAEILLLVYARSILKRISPATLIMVGAIGGIIRWPLIGLSPPLFLLFPIQILHALTFAATYTGTVEFIGRAVPDLYRTTAMTLISTLGVGAMTGIASVIAGQLFAPQAPLSAYMLMAGMT